MQTSRFIEFFFHFETGLGLALVFEKKNEGNKIKTAIAVYQGFMTIFFLSCFPLAYLKHSK